MRSVAAVALAAACAAFAVCPADRDGSAAADTIAAIEAAGAADGTASGLHATLLRSRLFELRRSLHLAVRNDGAEDVQIRAIQLDSPLFDTVEPEPRDPLLHPGDPAVAMPVPFGDARCGETAAGSAQLVLDVDGDEVAVPLVENPAGLLAELHASECAVAAIREDVDVHLGDEWTQTGPRTVAGEVVIEQLRPGVETTVADLDGNVIFTLDTARPGDPGPVLRVDDERPTDRVGVSITASRCDAHALIEYKRTFTFLALVDVGEDRPLRLDVKAEGDTLRLLEDVLTRCIG